MLYSLFQILGFGWLRPSSTLKVIFKGQSADLNTKHFFGITPITQIDGSIGRGVGKISSISYLPSLAMIYCNTSFFQSKTGT